MNKKFIVGVVALLVVLLAGCSSVPSEQYLDPSEQSDGTSTTSTTSGISTTDADSGTTLDGGETTSSSSSTTSSTGDGSMSEADLLKQIVVYFDFDSSALNDLAKAVVSAHANHVRQRPGIQLRLVGHTDERGSREYNLALGDRRSSSVSKLFQALAVEDSRISTASMGEEQPASIGHDEESWQLNRRVEIIYQ